MTFDDLAELTKLSNFLLTKSFLTRFRLFLDRGAERAVDGSSRVRRYQPRRPQASAPWLLVHGQPKARRKLHQLEVHQVQTLRMSCARSNKVHQRIRICEDLQA